MNDNKFNKDPHAVEWFGVDWTRRLAGELPLIAPDTIATSTWTLPAALTPVATMLSTPYVGVKLSGGVAGQRYEVVNTITTTTNTETLQATLWIIVKDE